MTDNSTPEPQEPHSHHQWQYHNSTRTLRSRASTGATTVRPSIQYRHCPACSTWQWCRPESPEPWRDCDEPPADRRIPLADWQRQRAAEDRRPWEREDD